MSDLFINKPNKSKNNTNFDSIRISIASPEVIYSWSHGEVKKPETINYRTLKPERGGLFCAQIFGPIKDNCCLCGKYKKLKHKGMVCEKCGVEVTLSNVRRERMGHIELVSPVAHTWFLRSLPSRIGLMLDMTLKNVESILYFENNVVVDGGLSEIPVGKILNFQDTNEVMKEYGDEITISSGAAAIRTMLSSICLKSQIDKIKLDLEHTNSDIKLKRLYKRLRIMESFYKSKNKPEWMILTNLPVLPPDLRPLVPLEGARFATSDLNELYRRVINRNNRLKKLIELKAPDIILRNEKRMLQESVDSLLDNSKSARAVLGSNAMLLKSLTDSLKGKRGRFRQNLLGKRVDYSGRSIITAGPTLKFYECGLPKEMALELFRPHLYGQLQAQGLARTIKTAKTIVDNKEEVVWDILDKIIYQHPILLNRAPSLHRLSIQAFEPKLIEGKSIQLHPLVCAPFNADFDGDSMAVHVPLTLEAQLEARVLMLSSNNILNASNGETIINTSQDIILGLYYATLERIKVKGEGKLYDGYASVHKAYSLGILHIHARIRVRMPDIGIVNTTTGRVLISNIIPPGLPFSLINKLLTKKETSILVKQCLNILDQKTTVILLDNLMYMGFMFATQSGTSLGLEDMIVSDDITSLIKESNSSVTDVMKQHEAGIISKDDRYRNIVGIWSQANKNISDILARELKYDHNSGLDINPLYMMYHSGARGSMTQIKQVCAMRGLMASPTGDILETAITSNLKQGLTVLEYFISTSGARKGLADTSLRTATAGYLTRRLVGVSQDIIVQEDDCLTTDGLVMTSIIKDGTVMIPLSERVMGRFLSEDITLKNGDILATGSLIGVQEANLLDQNRISSATIRSPLRCKTSRGICTICYGTDLSTGRISVIGDAFGIVAAQAIGEPGTQLTMRTIHTGGSANIGNISSNFNIIAEYDCTIEIISSKFIINKNNKVVILSKNAMINTKDDEDKILYSYKVPYSTIINFQEGVLINTGEIIATWNPNITPILAEVDGYVSFENVSHNPQIQKLYDEFNGIEYFKVLESNSKYDFRPSVKIVDEHGNLVNIQGKNSWYYLKEGGMVYLTQGSAIYAGDTISVMIKEVSKSSDIVEGLPRIINIFEARKPKNPAIMSEISGHVQIVKESRGKQKCLIECHDEQTGLTNKTEILIPKNRILYLSDGDFVHKGDIIADGPMDLNDILRVRGVRYTEQYLVNTIQETYKSSGININDRHIEIIIKCMLSKARITESSDYKFIPGELVEVTTIEAHNKILESYGLPMTKYEVVLLGITKASLSTKSFLAAASFQDTTRVLTEAAIGSQIDPLHGLRENILIGRLIPAGTSAPTLVKRVRESIEQEMLQAIDIADLI